MILLRRPWIFFAHYLGTPPAEPEDLLNVIAERANGARTLVRRTVGWRRGREISQRASEVPALLRDKSRAPGQFLVGALNTYGPEESQSSTVVRKVRVAVLSGDRIPLTLTLSHGERGQAAADSNIREVRRPDTALSFADRQRSILPLPKGEYVFSVVGTSRCDVRAACSGATPWNASIAGIFVPPATTRAGRAQRAIPTNALNTYKGEGRG